MTLLSLFLYLRKVQALLYFTYIVISYVIPCASWFTCLYVHWSNYTAAEGSELLQLWQQHNTAPIKPDVVKISSCRLYSQSCCSKANWHNDSPLHPTAEEDAMVCGLCFISGTGRRNLLLDWYANTLPAVPESIFLEKEEPPRIISDQRLAFDSLSQLCQPETGQLDGKRLKFRLIPHLLLLFVLKSRQGSLEVVIGQTCLLHLSHSL